MTTLPDIRTRLRLDLRDTDSGAYRWTDATLDRHIAHALEELGLAVPRELTATVATTAGSRELSLSGIAGLVEVEAVEFPVGEFPPSYVRFSRWASSLRLHTTTAPAGENAKLWYVARHTLDGTGSSLPVHLEDVLLLGATAYALLEISAFSIDRLNTGGAEVNEMYAAAGRARLTAFQQLLHQHARRNTVRYHRVFTPA